MKLKPQYNINSIVFILLLIMLLPQICLAANTSINLPTKDDIFLALMDAWPRLPADSEITQAYNEMLSIKMKNVSVISGPTKMNVPEETDPLSANKVVIKLHIVLDSANNITSDRAMILKYDYDSSKFVFNGVLMPGIIRQAGDTASYLMNEDLKYLNSGWINGSSSSNNSNNSSNVSDNTNSQNDENGIPWEVVIGGAAIGAAAAALVKKALSGKNKKGKNDEPAGYILKLSSDRIQVTDDSPGTLQVTAYRVNKSGAYTPAPEVKLRISSIPNSCLKISPSMGQSHISAVISKTGNSSLQSETLTITGIAPKSQVTATATVEIAATYKIVFF